MNSCISRFLILSLLFLGGSVARAMDFAVILVGVRDADNYLYIQDHQYTVARLNQNSPYWNYVPVYVEYFSEIPSALAAKGISKYSAAIVAHARFQNGVYTGWLRDFRRTPGLIDMFTTKPGVEEYVPLVYHCGMDGNNGIITFDHVGTFLAIRNGHNNYIPWGAPDLPSAGPTHLGSIILSNATFSVTTYTGALIIGDNNIITVNYGAQVFIWGKNNTVYSVGNNFMVFWEGSTGNTVHGLQQDSLVNVASHTTTTVNGYLWSPGNIGICGNLNLKLTASFARLDTINGAIGELTLNNTKMFMANNNMHTIKVGSHFNEITNNGHGNFVMVESGNTGNAFFNGGPGDLVNVAANTSTSATAAVGQRSNVGITGANAIVTGVRQNVESAPYLQNMELGGTDNIFNLQHNSSLKVTGWVNRVNAHGFTQTHFWGTDNTLGGSYGGNNDVTLEVNRTHTVQGAVSKIYFHLPTTGTATTTLNTSGNPISYSRWGGASGSNFRFHVNGNNNQSTINNGGNAQIDIVHQGTGNKVQGSFVPSGQLYRDSSSSASWGTSIVTTWYWWPSMVYISHTVTSDPFIFDFTGRKVATQPLASSIAAYDFEGDGKLNRTAWGLPGQGYLVHKKNSRSTSIDKGELIEGLQHLRQVLGSEVAVLDKSHQAWSELRIWIDLEGTGKASNGELRKLEDIGIASINLGSANLAAREDNGNIVLGEGTFTMENGDICHWAGVNLRFEP